jgi:uncharacterized protein YdiU (UPF0061 family)
MENKSNNNKEQYFPFNNTYDQLPEHFYSRRMPTPVKNPQLIKLNEPLATQLGLDFKKLNSLVGAALFSGNSISKDSNPIAMVYAGHQFGYFVPQLGDGRAILLGEIVDKNNQRLDIQLKGSGQTPYSRRGDGRAALGPVMREYIISEAMHNLGIPTTRSLAMVSTGEMVMRETALPGAILTRVASSHIRVGTFEYFSAMGDVKSVKQLADYAINRHYPAVKTMQNPYIGFLNAVCDAQASLVAKWMNVGFIHGVMNTDNMTISGETIDYGPCAFMDEYQPSTVFSSIDYSGRYAYKNQSNIAQWNIARLAETLLPLLDKNESEAAKIANEIVHQFSQNYENYWWDGLRRKLGLFTNQPQDIELIKKLFVVMHVKSADFTNTFRMLSRVPEGGALDSVFEDWSKAWLNRQKEEGRKPNEVGKLMRSQNPAFIPRNHLVQKAIDDAVEQNNFETMNTLLTVLSNPYEEQPQYVDFQKTPTAAERVTQTFCGT